MPRRRRSSRTAKPRRALGRGLAALLPESGYSVERKRMAEPDVDWLKGLAFRGWCLGERAGVLPRLAAAHFGVAS